MVRGQGCSRTLSASYIVDDLEVLLPNPSKKHPILRSEEKSVAQKLVNSKAGEGS